MLAIVNAVSVSIYNVDKIIIRPDEIFGERTGKKNSGGYVVVYIRRKCLDEVIILHVIIYQLGCGDETFYDSGNLTG